MTVFAAICFIISIVFGGLGVYATIRNIAVDDIGELRYMLRCAKERQKIVSPDNEELTKIAKEEVEDLEERYRNHWGWRFAGNRNSLFDFIPTPGEERNEKRRSRMTYRILEAKYRNM